MKKKFICLLISLSMILTLAPAGVFADDNDTYTINEHTYDKVKGYVFASGSVISNGYYEVPFYYTDGLFEIPSTEYDVHLATMSMGLAIAGMRTNYYDYMEYRHEVTRDYFTMIGCSDDSIYVNNDSLTDSLFESIGVAMASKELCYSDGTNTGELLVPITIRGAGYELEWANNATLGASGEAEGFSGAATKAYDEIIKYIDAHDLEEAIDNNRIKFWIAGYSRGATVANIVAKRLVDKFGTDHVYAYTFEAPMGGVKSEERSGVNYNCIHNIVNESDLITKLAPAGMGFKRYGQDHLLVQSGNSGYSDVQSAMESNLRVIIPDLKESKIEEVTNFKIASCIVDPFNIGLDDIISLLPKLTGGNTSLEDFFKPVKLSKQRGNVNALRGDWIEILVDKLNGWGGLTRETYAAESVRLGNHDYDGIQTAAANVINIFMNMTTDQQNLFLDRASTFVDAYEKYTGKSGLSLASELFDLLEDLENWNTPKKLSDTQKEALLEKFWNVLVLTGAVNEDLMSAEEKEQMRRAWPTVANLLLSLVCTDAKTLSNNYATSYYTMTRNHGSSWTDWSYYYYPATDGSELTGKLAMVSSIILNVEYLLNSHDYLVNLAWLRTGDDWYDESDESILYNPSASISIPAPTAWFKDIKLSKDSSNPTELPYGSLITLDSLNYAGESIFYKVGSDSSWNLYRDGIRLPMTEGEITISAYAHSNRSGSGTVQFYVKTVAAGPEYILKSWLVGGVLNYKLKHLSGDSETTANFIVAAYTGEQFLRCLEYKEIETNQIGSYKVPTEEIEYKLIFTNEDMMPMAH